MPYYSSMYLSIHQPNSPSILPCTHPVPSTHAPACPPFHSYPCRTPAAGRALCRLWKHREESDKVLALEVLGRDREKVPFSRGLSPSRHPCNTASALCPVTIPTADQPLIYNHPGGTEIMLALALSSLSKFSSLSPFKPILEVKILSFRMRPSGFIPGVPGRDLWRKYIYALWTLAAYL